VILHRIFFGLASSFHHNDSLSMISRSAMSLSHLKRSLSLLNPWLIKLDLVKSNRIKYSATSCNYPQIDCILRALFVTEQSMAAATMISNQLDLAEGHCQ
jgi:hypothetical protein